MKTYFIAMIIFFLKRLRTPEAVEFIRDRVAYYADLDIPGAEKKAKVIEDARTIYRHGIKDLAEMSGNSLDGVISIVLSELRAKQGA